MKKYTLHNSYFKVNKSLGLPDTVLEIAEYEKEHGELPFRYYGNNWAYDAFVERQKYSGVRNSQFLTPDGTVERMLDFAGKYFTGNDVLEPCCGTGQITGQLIKSGYRTVAFDNDHEMAETCKFLLNRANNLTIYCKDFRDFDKPNKAGFSVGHYNQIIANPPYYIVELTDFLEWIDSIQDYGGISILLLPKGFIGKDRPRRTFNSLRKFGVLECEDMREKFARTNTSAEIVVLKNIKQ